MLQCQKAYGTAVEEDQKLDRERDNHFPNNINLTLDPPPPPPPSHLHLYSNPNPNPNPNNFLSSSINVEQQHLFHQNQLLYDTRLELESSQHQNHQFPPPPAPAPKKRAFLPSSSSLESEPEHARLRDKMGESSHHHHHLTSSSRLGVKSSVGEIVEVQGGHIVRSTGRKDRHSKVCTAKGPRDRRVRLAAHTAIQFYDVQDRLGYDRPSKAVDWLIKKAKSAIDELAQLPAWHPTASPAPNPNFDHEDAHQKLGEDQQQQQHQQQGNLVNSNVSDEHQDLHHRSITNNSGQQISSFLPPSLDSDVIADTIKSFFPMGASDEATSSSMQFQSFPTPDLMQRGSSHSQDLRLSLQSFQDPILLHHHHQHHQSPNHHHTEQAPRVHGQVLLSGTPLGFDGSAAWPDHHQFQRLAAWNAAGGDAASGSAAAPAGYFFNSPAAPQPLLQQLLGHNQLYSQRGPLQSSNSPSVRAWIDPSSVAAISTVDHGQQHPAGALPLYPPSVFASGYGGFTGFHIPARIQGEEEEHDGYSDKPSSASSDSHH